MADKDKSQHKTTRDGGKDKFKETKATQAAHPQTPTKPATKKNYPRAEDGKHREGSNR